MSYSALLHGNRAAATAASSALALPCRVWLRRPSLNRRLAQGEDPTASRALALRAGQLASPRTRQRLAEAIERVIEEAKEGPRRLSAAAPVSRQAVTTARPLLLTLAGELRTPGPVRAQGVALTRRLLTDGASPLYALQDERALESAIDEARRTLLYPETGR